MSFCLSNDVSVGFRDELMSDVGFLSTVSGVLVGANRDLDDVDLHSHLCRRLDEVEADEEEGVGSILHCTQAGLDVDDE